MRLQLGYGDLVYRSRDEERKRERGGRGREGEREREEERRAVRGGRAYSTWRAAGPSGATYFYDASVAIGAPDSRH